MTAQSNEDWKTTCDHDLNLPYSAQGRKGLLNAQEAKHCIYSQPSNHTLMLMPIQIQTQSENIRGER